MSPRAEWAAWAGAAAGTFAVLEARALRRDGRDGTLSECLRLWLGTHPRKPWAPVTTAAVVAGCAWFALHVVRSPSRHAAGGVDPGQTTGSLERDN